MGLDGMTTLGRRRASFWMSEPAAPHLASLGGFLGEGAENLLALYVVLLIAVPSEYTLLPALGSVGRPSTVLGLAFLVAWCIAQLSPTVRSGMTSSPIRILIAIYFLAWNTSVAFAYVRGLSGVEWSGAERYFISTLSLCGVGLAVSESLVDRESLDRFLKRLTYVGAFMGAVGVLQFYTPIDLVRMVRLPLPLNSAIDEGLATRGSTGLVRAASTTQHSIEFGVLSAMLMPLGLHFALLEPDKRMRRLRWAIAMLCGFGVAISVARSGTIAAAVVVIVMLRVWNRQVRVRALISICIVIVVLRATTPGLVGTIISFFRNIQNDNSVEGRTQDYDAVFRLVADRPLFGLGGGTFRPEQYFILDNYVLNALISTGVIGLGAFLILVLGAYSMAIRLARRAPAAADRHLAVALAAAILSGFFVSFTFDSMNFAAFAGTNFVLIGAVGALWRTVTPDAGPSSPLDRVVRNRDQLRPILTRHTEAVPDVVQRPRELRGDGDAR